MASGMEMMLANLLKAFGFNPKEIELQVMEYAGALRKSLTSLDDNLKAINARLERLEQAAGIAPSAQPAEDADKPHITQQ